MMLAKTRKIRHQSGFTLVELMVAMAIGVTLVLGTATIFDAFLRSSRFQQAVSAQTDSGRYALDRLTREIRMSGYRDQAWLRPPLANAMVVEDGGTGPDAITVRYEGAVDCAGNATVGPAFLVSNRFDVNNGNLRCNNEVLVLGVEDFQILLGEDTDADGASNRIVPPGTVGLDPGRIDSVRVHLLMATTDTRIQRAPQQLTYFGALGGAGETKTYSDGRRRLELSTVLSLRNPITP
jgi:type IV pilus assembly protein PilW